jgi:hypothetical protein
MEITGTSHFSNDLGLDSLDTVEVVMAIEEAISQLGFMTGSCAVLTDQNRSSVSRFRTRKRIASIAVSYPLMAIYLGRTNCRGTS